MKKLSRLFALGIIVSFQLFLPHSVRSETTALSNDLPKALVEQLFNNGLWENTFDDPTSSEAKDLREFLRLIFSRQPDLDSFADNLFGSQNANAGETGTLPHLYPAKIVMLRFYRPQLVDAKWKNHYLQMAITTTKMAGISELDPVVQTFREKLSSGEIRLLDLSPEERQRLRTQMPERTAIELLQKKPGSTLADQYEVTGLFSAHSKVFAIDFARPIEETIITFIHEMIHAADPNTTLALKTYEATLPAVLTTVARWLPQDKNGNNEKAGEIAEEIISQVFFETGLDEIVNLSESVRNYRIKNLRDLISGRTSKEDVQATEEELTILARWMRAAIGLTLENEYRAYGLSLIAYSSLSLRMQATPPSSRHQKLVEQLLRGDNLFAANLSVGMNPFPQARSTLFKEFLQGAMGTAKIGRNEEQKRLFSKISQILDQLEFCYLEQLKDFIQSIPDQFSNSLKEIEKLAPSRQSTETLQAVLPEWARPGGMDLPSNPYLVAGARMTTAWVLRFRQEVNSVAHQIKEFNEPLVTGRTGILDLHDVTRGERRLIGISFQDSPWDSDPQELDPKLSADLDNVSRNFAKYFSVVKWSPPQAKASAALSSEEIIDNLTRLRALKALAWMDQSFPPFKMALLGTKSFMQRIHEGIYSLDDLSRERAQELEKELVQVWKNAGVSRDELMEMELLWKEVFSLRTLAQERNWPELETALLDKNLFIVRMLEQLGVTGEATIQSIEKKTKENSLAFERQLQRYTEQCSKSGDHDSSRLSGFWPEKGPFNIGEYSFPLTMLCFQKRLYAVRQPGDFIRFMTTQVRDAQPEVRIFTGARPVRLAPMKEPAPKKKPWYNW